MSKLPHGVHIIDFRTLEIYYWVIRLGGFRRAAERLNTSQPAVSARILQMESYLEVRLIERSRRRRLAPTQKGLELFGYAERILRLHREMITALTGTASVPNFVRLGVSETIVHTWFPEFVRRLHAGYPGITLEVSVDVSSNLRQRLIEGDIDIAFLLGPVGHPLINDVPLNRFSLAWLASPSLPLEEEGPVPLDRIVRWPVITYARNTLPHQQIAEMFDRMNLSRVRMFGNSSLASIIRMAVDGIGVAALPLIAAEREIADGSLRVLESDVALPTMDFTASYVDAPSTSFLSSVANLGSLVAASICDHAD